MRGNAINKLLHVCLQDLSAISGFVLPTVYILKDKTSENSAKQSAPLNAFLTVLNRGLSTNNIITMSMTMWYYFDLMCLLGIKGIRVVKYIL